ncbi:MAG: DALR anticodon-binding domain-containing protein, partial [Gammaproteobacteria bacterium]
NGDHTYFSSDVAYHLDKYNRSYDRIINIWGSDHHGYLPRVRAAMEASGRDTNKLEVVFIQFANLVRNGEKISMSTRSGDFITLNELMNEVTAEAARFFYINRKADQHLEFDLELAKEQTKDNPLYYIQYAHARICSVFNKVEYDLEEGHEKVDLSLLTAEKEIEIQKQLATFPALIEKAAKSNDPHLICYYLKDLASLFHSYYNSEKFIIEDSSLMISRMFLLKGVKQVIFNGLEILGVSSPEAM